MGKHERKKQVIEEAARLFSSRRFDEVLMDDIAQQAGVGKGTIYTYSVMRRADPQYAIAYVTLEEGITMMTNIVDCDFDSLTVGQAVELDFYETENGQRVPVFKMAV